MNTHASNSAYAVFLLVMLFASFSLPATGADISGSQAYKLVYQNCPKLTDSLLLQPDFVAIKKHSAVDVAKVCSCAGKATLSDSRLKKFAKLSEAEFDRGFQDHMLRSYFTVRMTQSILSCFAIELDAVLNSVNLDKHG